MPEIMLVKEAALKWGLTERRVADMCQSGRIPGAYKQGKTWYIPADTVRPYDGRVKTGTYKTTALFQKNFPFR